MNHNIGDLIKNYRRERGLSQLDLEMGIGAAAGSFTKIESGKINPSKETLYKVIEFMELSPAYALRLFNIDISFMGRVIEDVHKLADVRNITDAMSIALNDIRDQMGLAGGAFYLVEEGEVRLKALSATPMMTLVRKIVKDPFRNLKFSLEKHQENLLVQAVLQNKIMLTDSLYDVVRPGMSQWLANRAQKITLNQELIVLPITSHGKVVGAVTYGSLFKNKFRYELDVLKSFVAEIGLALEKLLPN